MDLRSQYPYWLLKNGFANTYPVISDNIDTEVAIIGAGITGALVGYHLCKAGVAVVFVDRRHAGMGSTCASTALLQYEIDTPLHQLTGMIGTENAFRSYGLCAESILKLQTICQDELTEDVAFERKTSLFHASTRKDVGLLENEFAARKKLGVDIEWLDKQAVRDKFGFSAPAALLSGLAAQVDAYQLTQALLQACLRMGAKVFDTTAVTGITHGRRGVELKTDKQFAIKARRLVMASGYESRDHLPDKSIIRLNSTFAIISKPILDGQREEFWQGDALVWETAQPYLYMRTTADRRILIGGKDEPFYNPAKRDALLEKKKRQLENAFAKKLPHLPFATDFYWAGTFAETKDGLPYIGTIREMPHTYFALGFGGNGITFSLISAELIRDSYLGKRNADGKIFAFGR